MHLSSSFNPSVALAYKDVVVLLKETESLLAELAQSDDPCMKALAQNYLGTPIDAERACSERQNLPLK